MKRYPNVTLKIIIKSGNKILLLRRNNGQYEFPGGRLEYLESLEQAMEREIKEELGAALPSKPELFHVWNYIANKKNRHSVMVYYICEAQRQFRYRSPEKLKTLWVASDIMERIVSDPLFVRRMYAWRPGQNGVHEGDAF